VGFGTLRTFNRAFLRQTGKTPSEYRRTGSAPSPGQNEIKTEKRKEK